MAGPINISNGTSPNRGAAPPKHPNPKPILKSGRPSVRVREYVWHGNESYSELEQLRRDGWRNPAADDYYAHQRELTAANNEGARVEYFEQRCKAAEELDDATHCMKIDEQPARKALKDHKIQAILDLCSAPGGFAVTAMINNPKAYFRGITLMDGTHIMAYRRLAEYNNDANFAFGDVNMLVGDMGFTQEEFPANHPDAENFVFSQKFPNINQFDLVFCGGATAHDQNHAKPNSDSVMECLQLTLSQLLIAMKRIREGGTMVVHLYRPEMWITCQLIYMVSKFADVELFKPRTVDRMYKTFYLVAKNVNPTSATAEVAVKKWKDAWMRVMFEMTSAKGVEDINIAGKTVDDILKNFGKQLLKLGGPVWYEQAEALKNPPWKKDEDDDYEEYEEDEDDDDESDNGKLEDDQKAVIQDGADALVKEVELIEV